MIWRWLRRSPESEAAFAGARVPRLTEAHPLGLAAGWESRADSFAEVRVGAPGGRPEGFVGRPSPEGDGSLPPPDYEVVQRAGEMVVFPGHWWHQVYHYGPTLAVASQYCNDRILHRCLAHVLDWCGVGTGAADGLLAGLAARGAPPYTRIEEALRLALEVRGLPGGGAAGGARSLLAARLSQLEAQWGLDAPGAPESTSGPPGGPGDALRWSPREGQRARRSAPCRVGARCARKQRWPRQRRRASPGG